MPAQQNNQRKAADAIREGYVSPILRWSFAREDNPARVLTYDVISADESGIHLAFRADTDWFIRAVIETPGEPDAVALKAVPKTVTEWRNGSKVQVPAVLDHEMLVVLQTKALGRACKILGYPDDLDDFKAMVLWRQRNREIANIGAPAQALASLSGGIPVTGGQHALPAGVPNPATDAAVLDAVAAASSVGSDDDTPINVESTEGPSQLTPEDVEVIGLYADAVQRLEGADRGRVAKVAFEQHSQSNMLRVTDPAVCRAMLDWMEQNLDFDGGAGFDDRDGGGND